MMSRPREGLHSPLGGLQPVSYPLRTRMVSAQTLRTLFRYILTGGTAAVVDLSIFTLLHGLGVQVPMASACSSGVAVVVNYTLSSTFVFKMPLSLKGFLLFFLGALVGLSINNGVVVAGSSVHLTWKVAGIALTPFQPYLAKVAGIGTAFLFNFWLNSTVVFRGHADHGRQMASAAVSSVTIESPGGAAAEEQGELTELHEAVPTHPFLQQVGPENERGIHTP